MVPGSTIVGADIIGSTVDGGAIIGCAGAGMGEQRKLVEDSVMAKTDVGAVLHGVKMIIFCGH